MTDATLDFFKDKDSSANVMEIAAQSEPWQRTKPFAQPPAAAILKITRDGEDNFQFAVTMLTADGRKVMEFDSMEGVWTYPSGPDVVPPAGLSDPTPDPPTKALFERTKTSGSAALPSLKTLAPFFDDPVKNDFLRPGNQELLTALAAQRHRSVVACLPDEAAATYGETLDLRHFFAGGGLSDWTVSESPNMIEVQPRRWVHHWHTQADRRAMAACVSDFRRSGHIGLESFTRLMTRSDNPEVGAASNFTQLVDPIYGSSRASFRFPFQPAFTGLLASLAPDQTERLRRGETIPYRSLSAAQRAYAARIVYGTRTNGETDGEYPGGLAGVDPTFELPGGLLDGAGLSASYGEDTVAVFHNGRGGDEDEFFEDNLSEQRQGFWSGPPPRIPLGGMAGATVDFRRQRRITLFCSLAPGHRVVGKFSEPLPSALTKPMPLAQAPPTFRKRIDETAKFLDSMGRSSRDGGSRKP